MKRSVVVNPLATDQIPECPYDLVIGTTGFESRARSAFELWRPRAEIKWAPAFKNRHELSFQANQEFFSSNGYDTEQLDDKGFRIGLAKRIQHAAETAINLDCARILVDVSSMSRFRMASIIEAAATCECAQRVLLHCVYTFGKYVGPPEVQYPIVNCGPVTNWFGGWCGDPSEPTVAVFGAGYEQDQVIGVLDVLEAAQVWVFTPVGPDSRYAASVNKANATLWAEVPRSHRLKYTVLDPYQTYIRIESLLYGLSSGMRPVVIPFGPKIFAVCCMLASAASNPPIPLWRVSAGQGEPATERLPAPYMCGIAAEFFAAVDEESEDTPGQKLRGVAGC